MQKFKRNYKIIFEIGRRAQGGFDYIPEEELTIEYPFTLHLDIKTSSLSSDVSTGRFQLYNLAPRDRALLWKDNFDSTKYVTMSLYAGYGDNLVLVFKGDFLSCYSYRDGGSCDFITEIQTMPGMFVYDESYANATFEAGSDFPSILKQLLEDVPLYNVGYITPDIGQLKRAQTFIGQTMDILGREYGGYNIYIDKGELNILNDNEVVPGFLSVITAESGLLGSPKRGDNYLLVNMLFEPRIVLCQAVEILSDSLPQLNQFYKVLEIAHKGVISPAECGSLTTSLTLSLGNLTFTELSKTTSTYGGTSITGEWEKPIKNGVGRITSAFGARNLNYNKASKNHKGIDIGAPANTPVYAPANGVVKFAGWYDGYGKFMNIDNGVMDNKALSTKYGHLNSYVVAPGQQVTKGQVIGYVGSTGNSTGPHLHFEVLENGVAVNPVQYVGSYS